MDAIELVKKEMFRRKYSARTIQTYVYCLKKFLFFYKNKDLRKITKREVKNYLDNLVNRNASGSTINVNLNALKFLCEAILNKKFFVKIKFSKVPKELPSVLSKEEVINLIDCVSNDKQRLMVKLMYGSGLRVSELVNLRVNNLDFYNSYGLVKKGKGDKDRMFIIPEVLRQELIGHTKDKETDSYLFDSYKGHISVRTVQEVVRKAAKSAGIRKRVHPHTLRHSYATHLIENGYDVASVQSLLGHNSIKTTMVYLHIARPNMINVKSPLDSLELDRDNRK